MSMNKCVKCGIAPILKSKNGGIQKCFYYVCPKCLNKTEYYVGVFGIAGARAEWQTNMKLSRPNSAVCSCGSCGKRIPTEYNYCPYCGQNLKNAEKPGTKNMIKFISYDGKYPNLCSGNLVIEVDGKRHELGRCLYSGGRAYFDSDWNGHVEDGAWSVCDLPEELKPYRREIEAVVNDNVPHGCCGGCL